MAELTAAEAELQQTRAALLESNRRLAALESSATAAAATAAVATALAGHDVHAPDMLARLLTTQVTVAKDESGNLRALGPGFQPVADFVKERLASQEFAHFLKSNRGSLAANGAAAAQPMFPGAPGQNGGEPATLGEALIRTALASRTQRTTDPRSDMSQPMGLRRQS